MIIRTHAYARGGLIGNPSDGYFGKTISIIVKNFKAEVTLYESPELVIEPREQDESRFRSIAALVDDVRLHGYYGGVRLIKAAIRKFSDYCAAEGIGIEKKNFTITYDTNIPRLVGMAGSSAVVTATLRALMQFYGVDISKPRQANLILAVEKDELGIGAGLQDRVIQVYEGAVYMDFSRAIMERDGYGRYESLDPSLLPPLYMAYSADLAESSEGVHNPIRALFDAGDPKVVGAMKRFAELAENCMRMLKSGRGGEIGPLLDANFDLRTTICRISDRNMKIVRTARSTGASAKFAGSGGTIIGSYEGDSMYKDLEKKLGDIGCIVFKPAID